MKITIDTVKKQLLQEDDGKVNTLDIYSKEAFEIISDLWTKVGWNQKYPYTFSWLGRPIIQLPEDMVRIQEVLYAVKPDVIVETGVAHGGSLIYYASLCKAMGSGRVIGVDIEIRPHNREAIEAHELSSLITLIEGDSAAAETVKKVESLIQPGEKVIVILDSCHLKHHVLAELDAYHKLVTPDSYIVATDSIMKDLYDVPRGDAEWVWDNPMAAVREFIKTHSDFLWQKPAWLFNESELSKDITYWPGAWLKKEGISIGR